MKAIDDPNLAKKQFFIRIPGNYAELHEPFRNASKRIRFVGSRTSSVTRLGSLTVWRQLSAADGAHHTHARALNQESYPVALQNTR